MTNFEKYKDEILKLIKETNRLAVANGKPMSCYETKCSKCLFFKGETTCCKSFAGLIEWMYEEYKEPAPKLTAKERAFCEAIADNGNTNICRNEDGNLCVEWNGRKVWLDSSLFPFIERKTGRSVVGLLVLEVE